MAALAVTVIAAFVRARRLVADVKTIAAAIEPDVARLQANAARVSAAAERLSYGRDPKGDDPDDGVDAADAAGHTAASTLGDRPTQDR
ncbi:MAG: hypothetical protein WD377_03025 [Nitriliruptoraceae bacterium]